jgi:hypothetical protein
MSEPKDIPVLTDALEEAHLSTAEAVQEAWPRPLRERLYSHLTPLVERMVDTAVERALEELRQELREQLRVELETELERVLAITFLDKDPFSAEP